MTSRLLATLDIDRRRRAWLLLAAGFAALVLPRSHFGQREHLAFLLTLPFVALAAVRIKQRDVSRRFAIAIGLMGGAGFALKPHFLVAWLLLELLLLARLRRSTFSRPELITLVLFGAMYLLAVIVLVPDYLPMAARLAPWYDLYLNNGVSRTILLADPLVLFTMLALLALRISTPDEDVLTTTLTVTFVGFLAAAILQRKGFSYHFVAAACFGLVALARGWQVLPRLSGLKPSAAIARASLILIVAYLGRGAFDASWELKDPTNRRFHTDPTYLRLLPVVKELAKGEPIVVLSSNPAAGWPLTLDAGSDWASRYMSFWPLPALYDRQLWGNPGRIVEPRPPEQRSDFERQFVNEVAEDIERWHPRLIIVLQPDATERQWGGAYRFDYLRYFRSNDRFERLLRDYLPGPSVGRYAIWVRQAG